MGNTSWGFQNKIYCHFANTWCTLARCRCVTVWEEAMVSRRSSTSSIRLAALSAAREETAVEESIPCSMRGSRRDSQSGVRRETNS